MMPASTTTTIAAVDKTKDDTSTDFTSELSNKAKEELRSELQEFVTQHACHHRPIAVVTSGGTAVDLEVSAVRSIENFSTGLRGAISVEEFLKRGYAVIHLWRDGSSSPYGRSLSKALGIARAHHGITNAAFGRLFVGDQAEDAEDQMVDSVLAHEDPWMTTDATTETGFSNAAGAAGASANTSAGATSNGASSKHPSTATNLQLHRRIQNSHALQAAAKQRATVLKEGRLLTVPFRAVEEYIAKLQLCAMAVSQCQSLAIFYLAAAVSDFYIPKSERSMHKIQSKDNGGGLTLDLKPVPKVMGALRERWAPDAFVCSFKLETDMAILRQKAERAVRLYGCHMVVGNILASRYDKIWALSPADRIASMDSNVNVSDWPMVEIRRPKLSEAEALEALLIDHVVQSHFEYISISCTDGKDRSGSKAAIEAHVAMQERRRQQQKELFWDNAKSVALEWGGVVLGAVLSFTISSALRRRLGA